VADDYKKLFRFEHLEVWQRSADVTLPLGLVADHLAERHLYRYAEQLRGAALSISNNIAEGSGSNSNSDFPISSTLPIDPPLSVPTCCWCSGEIE
jgi:hypothetical protein